jgi:hypothetical protein
MTTPTNFDSMFVIEEEKLSREYVESESTNEMDTLMKDHYTFWMEDQMKIYMKDLMKELENEPVGLPNEDES